MNPKKRKYEVFIMAFALIISFVSCSFVFNRQVTSNETRVRNFYLQKKNSLDMVMVGSSMAFTAYSSPLAWKQQGYTSYVLGTSSATFGINKSMVKEVLKYQKPKAILIDLNGVFYTDKAERKESALRFWIDNIPYSKNKIETINELIPPEQRMSYYLPLQKYHMNWENLCSNVAMSFLQVKSIFRKEDLAIAGENGSTDIDKRKKYVNIDKYDKRKKLYPLSGKHLHELLEYLKDNNVKEAAFVIMPRLYDKKILVQRGLLNEAKDIIASYGFKVYDFEQQIKDIGLTRTDFYNADHLNFYGQRKMTTYFSNILANDFNLKGSYDASLRKQWDREYSSYEKLYTWGTTQIDNGIAQRYDYRKIDKIVRADEGK